MQRNEEEEGDAKSPSFVLKYRQRMIDKAFIRQLAEEKMEGTGNYLIDIQVLPGNSIKVEIDNNTGVNIDDCVSISRFIESKLDRDEEDFEIEVGSVGLTSPFKVLKQYQKNIGNEVEVLNKNGQKLHGILSAADEEGFTLDIEKKIKEEGAKRKITVVESLRFGYDEIKYTKYTIRF